MRTLKDISTEELRGKKVVLRVDFNFPLQDGRVGDDFRIKSHIQTIDYLIEQGARVAIMSHISESSPYDSFEKYIPELSKITGHEIFFGGDVLDCGAKLLESHPLTMCDNLRRHEEESNDDPEFAWQISKGFDIYVNDAFSVSHRKHASVSAITGHILSYAGFLITKETTMLRSAINAPVAGKTLVLGGAKISTKLPVIQNFINKAEDILVGGALVSCFLKHQGKKIGKSLIDENQIEKLKEIDTTVINIARDVVTSRMQDGSTEAETHFSDDVPSDHMILDIGPETAEHFSEIIKRSTLVIWNGPMGLTEVNVFAKGTRKVAAAVVQAQKAVIGGGDTINAVDDLGMLDKIESVSTGGGAMIDFLGDVDMPGLRALGYYD